jgi:hypothetical protein
MLPFLPTWETDATLRAAIQQSVQVSLSEPGAGAVLAGGEVDGDLRARGPRTLYTAELHARYARAFDVSLDGGAGAPADDLDADTALSASWMLTPGASLDADAQGSLATSYGVRAETRLIELDPFLFGQRLEYAAGGDLAYTVDTSARTSASVEGGYLQAGALAADVARAVGVDTHEGHVASSISVDVGPRDTVAPELRYTYTHFENALLDTDLHRGPADVHEVSLTTAASHEIARGFFGTAMAGVSVGTPMPILGSHRAVIAPDLAFALRWTGRRARATARYTYAYTSLGPRIGYGQQHGARLRIDVRPREGSRYRDLALRGTLRFAYGGAPLAADPDVNVPGLPPARPTKGTLTTTTLAAGLRVDVPVARGIAVTGGLDLTFVRGVIAPPPPDDTGRAQVTAMLTLGLAGTVSTDKRRTVTRDPEADHEAAARGARDLSTPEERREDRARTHDEHALDDAAPPDP